jgi:hypothetical protein
MIDLNHCRVFASQLNETRDCAVKATAIAAQIPYDQAHAALRAEGRKSRRGTFPVQYKNALQRMGFILRTITVRSKTVRTIGRELWRGTFLVQTRGHVLCVRDGQVHDWTDGRMHRVVEVTEVMRENQLVSVLPVSPPKPVVVAPRAVPQVEWFVQPISVNILAMKMGDGVSNKQARNLIDRLRRAGHPIKNVGNNTFQLVRA